MSAKVDCKGCVHFRHAPYEAKLEGCYHPDLMKAKQKDTYLDEQQVPGDHEVINRLGDCEQYEARRSRPGFWQRLFSIGA